MKAKKILFIFILGVMCIPFLQSAFVFVKTSPLAGISDKINNKPKFTLKSWFTNKYQDSTDIYFDENIGFRPWFIKLVNQVDYSFFNYTKAPGVVIGKKGNLFIESYIIDYIGKNFIGENKVAEEVEKLEKISDFLSQNNITLIVMFTPGKASFYPEFIPAKYQAEKKTTSNYECYIDKFKKSKVRFLDFNDYFKKIKGKTPYPVYSRVGTHWSSYAKSVVLDSLIRYIEKNRNIDMPEFDWSEVVMTDKLKKIDWDIEELMNLIWPIKHEKMPYPRYKYNEEGKTKPSAVTIGDSYWWCIVGDEIPKHLFARDEYWFYCKDIYIDNGKQPNSVDQIDFKDAIMKQNVIILSATEATLHMFPYGFSQKFYDKILQTSANSKLTSEEKIAYWEKRITDDPEWLKKVQAKANEKNISFKEMLRLDAKFMAEQEK